MLNCFEIIIYVKANENRMNSDELFDIVCKKDKSNPSLSFWGFGYHLG